MPGKPLSILWPLSLACLLLGAAAPIPHDKRIEATIAQTLAAPPDQPMHMPTDVAVDTHGRIFIADGANNRILRFSSAGQLQQTISKLGDETLSKPVGLTLDAHDRLWIADTGNHRLLILSADGATSESIPLPNAHDAQPCDPTDIAITPDGQRAYVVDNDNHRILIRTNATGTWSTLGAAGRALGQFQWPFMLAIGHDNYVFVSEAIGARIQRISPADRWAGQIGRWGVELGQLYRPKGIAADAQGRLFVSDSTLGVIQVFSSRGLIEGVLTNPDGQPLRFEHPMGLCFDSLGKLYVVELRANRVAVISIGAKRS